FTSPAFTLLLVQSMRFSSTTLCLHRILHSFPTRTLFRSAGLAARLAVNTALKADTSALVAVGSSPSALSRPQALYQALTSEKQRSEEHTSELQSHLNLVCRLLLEKKNRVLVYK